jgi:Flp pilus assembly pilin Flp
LCIPRTLRNRGESFPENPGQSRQVRIMDCLRVGQLLSRRLTKLAEGMDLRSHYQLANNSRMAWRIFLLPKRLATCIFVPLGAHWAHRFQEGEGMNMTTFRKLWSDDQGQDIAEYAVMLAVILVLVVGTIRLIGGSSNNVFSSVASSIGS